MNNKGFCNITGIFGTAHGTGTTHLALSVANCLVSRSHRKTALIELSSMDLCSLLGENFEYHEGLYHFSLLGIEIFSPASMDLIDDLKKSFDEIVVDFGFKKKISHDLTLCDRVYMTASFSPYRIIPLSNYLRDESLNNMMRSQQIHLVCYGKNKHSIRWQKKNQIPIFYVPFIPDPLNISLKDSNTLIKSLRTS